MGKDNKIPASQVEGWEKDSEIDVVPGSALRPYTETFESVMNRAIKRRTMLKDDGFSIGFGQNDGVFAVPTEGPDRGLLKQFLSGVPGGEVCGPEFSGDNRTFFCAIQHPNDGKAFENIWPLDESDAKTPVSRPSLIGVREMSGRKIGK